MGVLLKAHAISEGRNHAVDQKQEQKKKETRAEKESSCRWPYRNELNRWEVRNTRQRWTWSGQKILKLNMFCQRMMRDQSLILGACCELHSVVSVGTISWAGELSKTMQSPRCRSLPSFTLFLSLRLLCFFTPCHLYFCVFSLPLDGFWRLRFMRLLTRKAMTILSLKHRLLVLFKFLKYSLTEHHLTLLETKS